MTASESPSLKKTMTPFTISNSIFDLAARLMCEETIRQRQVVTIKTVTMLGVNEIFSHGNFRHYLWLKQWTTVHQGKDIKIFLNITDEDRALIREAQRLIQDKTIERVNLSQVIGIAMLALEATHREASRPLLPDD
jgi:hypothetical protein